MPTAIFEAVLANLAVAAALAGVALAAGRWANRPALAHALWLLVLVKLLTPPLVTIPVRCLPARAEPTVVVPVAAPPVSPVLAELSPVVIVEPTPPSPPAPAHRPPAAPHAQAVDSTPPQTLLPSPSPIASVTRWVPA